MLVSGFLSSLCFELSLFDFGVYLLGIYIDFGMSPNSELKKMLHRNIALPEDLKVLETNGRALSQD